MPTRTSALQPTWRSALQPAKSQRYRRLKVSDAEDDNKYNYKLRYRNRDRREKKVSFPVIFIGIIIYLGIGVALMYWIKRDSEFREMSTKEMLAYGSIVLWPIFATLYALLKPPEALEDRAAKTSYQDFKNFMRTRKPSDGDLLKNLDKYKRTSPDKPMEITGTEEEFRDHHLEELINTGEYQEALRTANDMLRFAREQQEYGRVAAYERYIIEIKKKRSTDYV